MDGKLRVEGTEPLNAQLHNEFVALVAVYYSDELTDEEWALLQVHLAWCETCRTTFEQYKYVASDVIPMMAASAATGEHSLPRESDRDIAEAERRLMAQLGSTLPHLKESLPIQKASWKRVVGALAACVLVAVAFAGVRIARKSSQPSVPSNPSIPSSTGAPSKAVAASNEDLRRMAEQAQLEVASLQQKLAVANSQLAQPKSSDPNLQRQLNVDRTQQQALIAERDAVSQQLAAARADAQSLRDQIGSFQASADQQAARTTSLEAKVRELTASLDETNTALSDKDRILALDKDFLAHDRDIRDLIGARNLYIADIFDTNENGKTAKPFGRIFYTKDRSLVFYGFDLEKQSGLKQAVAFQAWGSGSDKQPTSLGLFYQDDTQKRWVLRCNDAKTLARMNMVFVTIEPPGGSARPTGKQLLRAYLQIQPNHL